MRSANGAVNTIKSEHSSADVEAMFVDLTSLKTVENFVHSYISRNMYASYIPIPVTLLTAEINDAKHLAQDVYLYCEVVILNETIIWN